MRLSGDVARLQAQVENGEALKQNLEYELAKINRELHAKQRDTLEREENLNSNITNYKSKGMSLL